MKTLVDILAWAAIALFVLGLNLMGCSEATAPPADDCDACSTCPPKRRCLFDSTSATWIVIPDTVE